VRLQQHSKGGRVARATAQRALWSTGPTVC